MLFRFLVREAKVQFGIFLFCQLCNLLSVNPCSTLFHRAVPINNYLMFTLHPGKLLFSKMYGNFILMQPSTSQYYLILHRNDSKLDVAWHVRSKTYSCLHHRPTVDHTIVRQLNFYLLSRNRLQRSWLYKVLWNITVTSPIIN